MKKILTAIFVIMLSTVSVSSNEIEYQKVIRSQIEAFSNDDMEAAFEFASPSIKSIFGNYIRFGSMVRQGYPMVFRQKNLTFKETKSKILRENDPATILHELELVKKTFFEKELV